MNSSDLEAYKKQQFINLTTFRKSGAGVVTPVWFVLVGDKLYGTTQPQTGKVKRIRNNAAVTFAPSTYNGKPLGEAFSGKARILTPEEFPLVDGAMRKKYGIQYRFLVWMKKLQKVQATYWEITPD